VHNIPAERKDAFLENGNTTIHYIEKGDGDTTLFFIHGWGINSSYWDKQLQYFGNKYRVVAMDLPGFGKSTSDRKKWSVQEYGNDVTFMIEKLALKNVILIGHSMSGDVILEAAVKNNPAIIGIIGIDNFNDIDIVYTPEQMEEMNKYFQKMVSNFSAFADDYAGKFLFIPNSDSSVKAKVKNDFVHSDSLVAISTITEVFNYDSLEKVNLEKLNYKLFLVSCADLWPVNIAGLEKHCKSSYEIYEIRGSGHYPMNEKPDEFNRLLDHIIQRIN